MRGLANILGVSKPVITRALNTLGTLGYLRRVRDEADRRNVFVAQDQYAGRNSLTASNGTSKATARPAAPPRNGPSSSSTAKRFALSGPSLVLDERVHAYRRDIADIALAGQISPPIMRGR